MRAFDKYITILNYIQSTTEQQRSRECNHSSSGAEIRNGWNILPLTHPLHTQCCLSIGRILCNNNEAKTVIVACFKAYACRNLDYLTGCDTVYFLQDYMVSHLDYEIGNSIHVFHCNIGSRLPDHSLSQPRIFHSEHLPV
jgi:hypothetical protein